MENIWTKLTAEVDPITELARLLDIDLAAASLSCRIDIKIVVNIDTNLNLKTNINFKTIINNININVTRLKTLRDPHQPDFASNTSCRRKSSSHHLLPGAEIVKKMINQQSMLANERATALCFNNKAN